MPVCEHEKVYINVIKPEWVEYDPVLKRDRIIHTKYPRAWICRKCLEQGEDTEGGPINRRPTRDEYHELLKVKAFGPERAAQLLK